MQATAEIINDVRTEREAPVRCMEWLCASDAQILTAEIDEVAAQMSKCYEQLPPHAKASALKLGHALSNLRRRVVAHNEKMKHAE